jgi:hypothetical protein
MAQSLHYEVCIAITMPLLSQPLDGRSGVSIERGFLGLCREPPRLSFISDMPQNERISRRRCRGKEYAWRRNVPQSRLLAGSRVDPETQRD